MAVKETIAIVGATKKNRIVIANKLSGGQYRLLFVSNGQQEAIQTVEYLKRIAPDVEADVIDCVKEGCWEADIIILGNDYINTEIIEKIKEVSTQKIVVSISIQDTSFTINPNHDLQMQLPYSKVVKVIFDVRNSKTFIKSSHNESVEKISNMISSLLEDKQVEISTF